MWCSNHPSGMKSIMTLKIAEIEMTGKWGDSVSVTVLMTKGSYFLFYISGHHQITEIILKLACNKRKKHKI